MKYIFFRRKKFFSFLSFFYFLLTTAVCLSENPLLFQKNYPFELRFSESDYQKIYERLKNNLEESSVTLHYQDKDYALFLQNGWLLPKVFSSEIPIEIKILIQIVFRLADPKKTNADLLLQECTDLFDHLISQDDLIQSLIDISFSHLRKDLLRQWLKHAVMTDHKAWIFFYLAQLEEDLSIKTLLLSKALLVAPNNKTIKIWSQYFSLNIAKAVLDGYEQELFSASIFRKMDMTHAKPTLFSAVKEAITNTTHVALINFTDYEDQLLTVWRY